MLSQAAGKGARVGPLSLSRSGRERELDAQAQPRCKGRVGPGWPGGSSFQAAARAPWQTSAREAHRGFDYHRLLTLHVFAAGHGQCPEIQGLWNGFEVLRILSGPALTGLRASYPHFPRATTQSAAAKRVCSDSKDLCRCLLPLPPQGGDCPPGAELEPGLSPDTCPGVLGAQPSVRLGIVGALPAGLLAPCRALPWGEPQPPAEEQPYIPSDSTTGPRSPSG